MAKSLVSPALSSGININEGVKSIFWSLLSVTISILIFWMDSPDVFFTFTLMV
jgi:hypothetical protein